VVVVVVVGVVVAEVCVCVCFFCTEFGRLFCFIDHDFDSLGIRWGHVGIVLGAWSPSWALRQIAARPSIALHLHVPRGPRCIAGTQGGQLVGLCALSEYIKAW
jgi:hypothetical protein